MTIRDFADDSGCERESPTMPCGRFKGRKINGLPDLYLMNLITADLPVDVQAAVAAECERRRRVAEARRPPCDGRPSREMAEAIITAGVKRLAMQCHPDVGGSHEQMLTLTASADLLRQRLARRW